MKLHHFDTAVKGRDGGMWQFGKCENLIRHRNMHVCQRKYAVHNMILSISQT